MNVATGIEWTGATVNPIRRRLPNGRVGHYCEKISAGCTNCYASRLQPRFGLPQFQHQRVDVKTSGHTALAQSDNEHRAENPEVAGSSPAGRHYPEGSTEPLFHPPSTGIFLDGKALEAVLRRKKPTTSSGAT